MIYRSKYSIAICPPSVVVDHVRVMKNLLKEQIKWFASCRSEAHITINTLEATDEELQRWKNYLVIFCKNESPFEIHLTRFDFNSTGAFIMRPDEASGNHLLEMMKKFHESKPLHAVSESTDAHLSIARRLKPEQLQTVKTLYENQHPDLKFSCDNIAIRKFNPQIRQYEIESRCGFAGIPMG